jgi:hypothetical protein
LQSPRGRLAGCSSRHLRGVTFVGRWIPPVDFRTVLASIKLASHLENISDQAVIIARRTRALIQESALEDDDGLTPIFELVDESLAEALEAFSEFDNIRAAKLRPSICADPAEPTCHDPPHSSRQHSYESRVAPKHPSVTGAAFRRFCAAISLAYCQLQKQAPWGGSFGAVAPGKDRVSIKNVSYFSRWASVHSCRACSQESLRPFLPSTTCTSESLL